jgi:hypothetical protein
MATVSELTAEVAALRASLAAMEKRLETYNPHQGIKILTTREHVGPDIIRYEPPARLVNAARAIQFLNTTNGNLDRPAVSLGGIPVLLDARNPHDDASWGLVEREWLTRFGADYALTWPSTINRFRVEFPAVLSPGGVILKPSTYASLISIDENRDAIHVGANPGQVNYWSFARAIKVWGGRRVQIWPLEIDTANLTTRLHSSVVVEKDGRKFWPLLIKDERYGVALEKLP